MQTYRDKLKLVDDDANRILGTAGSVHGDYTLTAMLRAIIINHTDCTVDRIRDGSTVVTHTVRRSADLLAALGADDYAVIISETSGDYFPSESTTPGDVWKSLDAAPYPINRYLSQFAKTRIFINEGKRRVVAVVRDLAKSDWMQAFLSVLPRVLVWYFTSDLTEEERSFFASISVKPKKCRNDNAERAIVEYVNRAASKLDLRNLVLHKYLDGYAEENRKRRIGDARGQVNDILRRIRSYQDELCSAYTSLETSNQLLQALEESRNAGSTELYDFFYQHKCLDLMSVEDDTIKFGVAETLEFYDEDAFERIKGREDSYLYTSTSDEDIPKVMIAVFAERRGMFVTNAVFELAGMRYVSMCRDLSRENVLPHPHIYFFRCAGGNDQYYSKYAESGEWQLAIEQAIGATKNLNFGDSTVVSNMIRWLSEHREIPCIKLTGSDRVVSTDEFLEIISEGEQQNG